jgi:hypothetical protein
MRTFHLAALAMLIGATVVGYVYVVFVREATACRTAGGFAREERASHSLAKNCK